MGQKQCTHLSGRVKSVDLHPTKPWLLASLYSGSVNILNYESKHVEKTLKITESPVRTAKFIARKHWIVTASDDKFIRVYNYDTLELIKEFEAHTDYIRCLSVHPDLPYVLSSSDDKLIKMWNWEKNWECTQTFEGHSHYVMQVAFNPKDSNLFASASLDGTIKIWNLSSPAPVATLEGHSRGVNCVEYFVEDDKLYLLSVSDDYTVKVWDAEAKSCVQTLEGHAKNVNTTCVHPEIPIIISVSEDGTWNARTYQCDETVNCDLGRIWGIAIRKGSHQIAFKASKAFLSRDWVVHFKHVYREGNRAADRPANLAFQRPLGYHILSEAPTELHRILLEDAVGVSLPTMI